MTKLQLYQVFLLSICLFQLTGALPWSGRDLGGSRTYARCTDNVEYLNGNICCINCPAGTRMTSPCTRAGERGTCEECDDGTYTEHTNSLKQCFKCTQCRSDQEIVRACTHTHDTECQCKSGRFCVPHEACEVCKKCSRCGEDEEIVRNCTSTSNTECKKVPSTSDYASAKASMIVPLTLFAVVAVVVAIVGLFVFKRCRRATDSQSDLPGGLKAGTHYSDNYPTETGRNGEPRQLSSSLILSRQPVRAKSSAHVEDEHKMLCESLSSSSSNSQHSLTGLPVYVVPASAPRACPVVPQQSNWREDEPFPRLVPVNGEESLRKCFTFFEEIDVNYHKRFFRNLGINDNVIKSKELLLYDDRVHELLNIWVEKEGKGASLNDLLKVLLELNQRRTAEIIKENAIHYGHYLCEE
ncbi:tumor necrosis factor receptor superfamily member 10B-like isoform X1 [Morone saxatilis]|uniref:tumor necrosis factor receptor superfamily member 10B-like isoform X1 n=1 Tax=Morone saxatilis TaxID=34816 RepID=UPI0015E20FD3|nr:tumor necrosis factor receptor superfamily member 10B-like isoform X1 [Morone saxatilis]